MSLERINAQQWYRTAAKADGITLIDEPWIKPFYRCNIWHVQGSKRGMVVDFGLGAVPLRQHVAQLAERDLLAVASHTHFDHIAQPTSLAVAMCMPLRRTSWPPPITRAPWLTSFSAMACLRRYLPNPIRTRATASRHRSRCARWRMVKYWT